MCLKLKKTMMYVVGFLKLFSNKKKIENDYIVVYCNTKKYCKISQYVFSVAIPSTTV